MTARTAPCGGEPVATMRRDAADGGLWRYFMLGTFFGLVLTKAQVVSWFRIQEMFRFQSF